VKEKKGSVRRVPFSSQGVKRGKEIVRPKIRGKRGGSATKKLGIVERGSGRGLTEKRRNTKFFG